MTSTATQSRCFCGNFTPENDTLYCSPYCAHQDALNSLTLGIPHPSSSTFGPLPTLPKGFFSDLPKKHTKPISAFDEDDILYPAGLLSPDLGPFASSKKFPPHSNTQRISKMGTGATVRTSHHRQRRSISNKGTSARQSSINSGPQSVPRSITTSVASSTRDDRGSKVEWKSHYQRAQSRRRSKGHTTLASDDIPVFLVQLLKDVEEMRIKEEMADDETRKEMHNSTDRLIKPPTITYRMGSFGPVAEDSLPSGMLNSCMTTPRAAVEAPAEDSPIEHYDPQGFRHEAGQRQFERSNSVSSHTSGSLMTSAAPDSDALSRSSWISRTTGSSQAGDSPVKSSYPNHTARAGEMSPRDANAPGLSVPEKRCKYGSAFGVHEAEVEEPTAPTTITNADRNHSPLTAKTLVPAPLPTVDVIPAKTAPPPPVPPEPSFKLSSTMGESRLFHRRLESRSKSQPRVGSQPTNEVEVPPEPVPSTNMVEEEEHKEIWQSSMKEGTRPQYLAPQAKREPGASGAQTTAAKLLSQHSSPFVTLPRKNSAPASLLRSQWPPFALSTMALPRPPTENTTTNTPKETPVSTTSELPADSRSRQLPGTVVRKTIMASKSRLPIGGTIGITAPIARPAATMLSHGNVASLFARPKSPSNSLAAGRPKTPSNASQRAQVSSPPIEESTVGTTGDIGPSAGGRAREQSVVTQLPQAGALTNNTGASQKHGTASAVPLPSTSKTSSITASAAFSLSLQANAFSSLGSALGTSNTYRAPAYAMSPPKAHHSIRSLHTSASTSSLRSNRPKGLEGREAVTSRHARVPSAGDESTDEPSDGVKVPDHRKAAALSADGESELAGVSAAQSVKSSVAPSIEGSERGSIVSAGQRNPSASAKTDSTFQLYSALRSRPSLLQTGSDVQSIAGSDSQSQAGSESSYPDTSSRAHSSARELALSTKTRERLEAARQRVAELRQARDSGAPSSRDSVLNGRLTTRVGTQRSLSPRSSPLGTPLSAKGSMPNSPSSEPPTPRAASPSMSSEQSLSPCASEAPYTPRDGERFLHIASPRDNLVSLVNTMGHVPDILISPSNGDLLDASNRIEPLLNRTKRLGSDASNTSTTEISSCGTDHSFVEGRSVMCVAEKRMLNTSAPSTAVRTTFAWDVMPR